VTVNYRGFTGLEPVLPGPSNFPYLCAGPDK